MNLLMYPLFLLAIIFSFYLPGMVLFSFLKKSYSPQEKFLLSWPVGVVAFLLFSYAFAWAHMPFAALMLPIGSLVYAIWKRKQVWKGTLPFNVDWVTVGILLLGVFSFSILTFFSGIKTPAGYTYYDVNRIDGLVHLALIKNMTIAFPPLNPSLAGGLLRGYHYFYDFLLSRFDLFYRFYPSSLEFRLFPIFISFLYGISFYLFSSLFTKRVGAKRLILFFAFFGENAGFLYSYFTSGSLFGDIGFPFAGQLVLDPSVVISIALLLTGLFFLGDRRKEIGTAILAGSFLGILSEVKVYAGLIGIGVLVIFTIYSIVINHKMWKWFGITVLLTGLLTVATFFPNNLGAGSLVFAPFLSYNHFISQPIFDNLHWQSVVQIYAAHNNFLHIAEKYAEAIAIFWLLILGVRSITVLFTGRLLKKSFWQSEQNVLLFLLFAVAICYGSFFIQTVSVFDIMQFFWIAVALFAIPTGICLQDILVALPKAMKGILLFLVIIFSAVPLGILLYITFFVSTKDTYTKDQFMLFRNIKNAVPNTSFIVAIPPYDVTNFNSVNNLEWYREPVVAAFTGRSTYYEPAIAYYHMYSSLYDIRQRDIFNLAKRLEACDTTGVHDLLQKIGTKYVVSFSDYTCIASTHETVKQRSAGGVYFYEFR